LPKEKQAMRSFLILALLWLVVAALAFAVPGWTIGNSDISIGWVLLLFVAWNLVRFWTSRPGRIYPKEEIEPQRHRDTEKTGREN
jgi:hypothetical protein